MARDYRRIGVVVAAALAVATVGAAIFARFVSLRVDRIYPVVVRPGEEVHVWVRNLGDVGVPRVSFAGIQLEVTNVRFVRSGTSIVVVRAPGAIGSAPVTVSRKKTTPFDWLRWLLRVGISAQELSVIRSNTVQYPTDMPYLLRNPGDLRSITPFGPQNVLVVAGYPTDVVPQFTVGDLDAAVQARYSVVSSYYSTISKNSLALSATLHPQIVPLTKKYGEYIHESRAPVARGVPVTYPLDLRSYTDRNLSIEVTGLANPP